MSAVWAVIRREYLQRVRSKWFVITTFAAPLLFLLMILAPIWLGSRGELVFAALDAFLQGAARGCRDPG